MNPSYQQALERAAALWGIQPEFWDIFGQRHTAQPEAQAAMLRGMGVDVDSAESLERAVEARLAEDWVRLLPPCHVVTQSPGPEEIPASLPEGETGPVRVTLRRENGQVDEFTVNPADLPVSERKSGYERRLIPLPDDLELGYHDVEAAFGGRSAACRLILAPARAHEGHDPERRHGGVAVQLYALRSERNWGVGDFTDLRAAIDWAVDDLGASFVALNPLHAIHNRRPFNTSPYLPNCALYRNWLYLDVEAIEDFQHSRRARACAADPALAELRATEFVDYERVAALKLRALKLTFAAFVLREFKRGTERGLRFLQYITDEGEPLERYATYCALDEEIHAKHPDVWVWREWPEEYRDPESSAVAAFRKLRGRRVMFYQWLQWQTELQLASAHRYARQRGMAIGLYHDLALATDRYGSDLWSYREFFVDGCRVGSPPDDFSPEGQDWAFPPPNSDHHRATGYKLFAETIRKNCRHGGALRIDHVMRFFRLYWIPEGVSAAHGTYVTDRHRDLLAILALESLRNQVIVIGEDLGTVEPEFRRELASRGILSYRLFYFEKRPDGSLRGMREYPESALASITTHDLPTLAGFWIGHDIEARRAAGVVGDESSYRAQWAQRMQDKQRMLDALFAAGLMPPDYPRDVNASPELTGPIHNAVIGYLAQTPCRLMAVNSEDLTKETAQQNLPGTTWQYPNWGRKMIYTLAELRTAGVARDFAAMYRHWLIRSGRTSR